MGGLGEEPQGSPVRYPGTSTYLVPPTRLTSGVRLNKPTDNEVIMTTSKITSPRRTRKTKSVPKTIQLSPWKIEAHAIAKAKEEFNAFMDNHSEAEWDVIKHLEVLNYGGVIGLMKEVRRLLGESAAKCKVIQFPVGGKRGLQLAKEA